MTDLPLTDRAAPADLRPDTEAAVAPATSMQALARPKPVVLCILDGLGLRDETADNAVAQAATPHLDEALARFPRARLLASEEAVGLPHGQVGNSEVGHTTIGAGRVVMQDLPRIGRALADGSLARGPALAAFFQAVREGSGRLHVMGLVSEGGVHAHRTHLIALSRLAAEAELEVVLHLWIDGRDAPPQGGADDVVAVVTALADLPQVTVGSVAGRYYPMDRDKRWERTAKAYAALVAGEAPRKANAHGVVSDSYGAGTTDEFIPPHVIDQYDGMEDGDGLLCINFRADRVQQILDALLEPDFAGFERQRVVRFSAVAGMTAYSHTLATRMTVLFPDQDLSQTLGELVADAGLTQLRVAETEKYPHVTFFFSGGREEPFPGEERILVPSPQVATYDLQPEMSAPEVARRLVQAVEADRFDLIVVNFANPDMVGHTGVLAAAIQAVEAADRALGQLVAAVRAKGGTVLVTADHGNAELMRDPVTQGPHTAHTTNPVPVVLVDPPPGVVGLKEGGLADLAPTLLALLGVPQPPVMTGRSLLVTEA